jgi:small nuclear ribonucleoprotein (snRNP)-like protein
MRLTVVALVASLITLNVVPALAQGEADAWRKVAETIPLGTKVKVQTFEGKRFSGILMRVDGNEVLVKRDTRRPEPAVALTYRDIAKIERAKDGGSNVGKAIAVGIAAAGGAMLTIVLVALAYN